MSGTNLAAMLGDREGAGRSSAGRTEGKENGTGHTLLTGTGDKPWVLVKNESGTRYLEHVTARLYKAQPPVTLPGQPRCTRPCLGAAISGRPRPAATSGPGPAPAGRSPPPLRPALRQPVAAVRRGPGPSDEPRPSAISARPSAALRGLGPGGSGGGHGECGGPGRAAGAAGAPALPEPREGGPTCREHAALGTALEDGYEGLRRWGASPDPSRPRCPRPGSPRSPAAALPGGCGLMVPASRDSLFLCFCVVSFRFLW